jgi:hypothetical protein
MAALASVLLWVFGAFDGLSGRGRLTLLGFAIVFVLGAMLSGYVHRRVHLGGFGFELTIAVFGGVGALFAAQLVSDLNLLPGFDGRAPFAWFNEGVSLSSRARMTLLGCQACSLLATLGTGIWVSAAHDQTRKPWRRTIFSLLALVFGLFIFGGFAVLLGAT